MYGQTLVFGWEILLNEYALREDERMLVIKIDF